MQMSTLGPAVSVLMPVYNGERYLSEAIESVLGQTFVEFELVIVDDGSRDASVEIAEAWARRDQRIRLVLQDHLGLVPALNRGLAEVRGTWVARMDADDICVPDRLAAQMGYLARHHDVTLLGTYARHIGEDGRVLGMYRLGPSSREEWKRIIAQGRLIQMIHASIMMNRDAVVREGGYDQRFRYVEDVELYNRMAIKGHLSIAMPEPKLLVRIHADSVVMRSHMEMWRMMRFVRAVTLARRTGREIDWAEFEQLEGASSRVRRAATKLGDVGSYLYRRAGAEFGRGHAVQGGMLFGAGFVLAPGRVAGKVATQILPLWRERVCRWSQRLRDRRRRSGPSRAG